MTTKTYTLFINGQDAVDYGSKKTAVKYGEESGKTYQVHSPSGAVVHAVQVAEQPSEEPLPTEEDIIGEVPTPEPAEPEKEVFRDFPGNYSIAMIPFTEILAEAFGGISVREERFPGKLTRRAHIGGSETAVDEFTATLDLRCWDVTAALRVWQKENIEIRRGMTDMQKYLGHREFIVGYGRRAAAKIQEKRS